MNTTILNVHNVGVSPFLKQQNNNWTVKNENVGYFPLLCCELLVSSAWKNPTFWNVHSLTVVLSVEKGANHENSHVVCCDSK